VKREVLLVMAAVALLAATFLGFLAYLLAGPFLLGG
jgi:hypothetical protein